MTSLNNFMSPITKGFRLRIQGFDPKIFGTNLATSSLGSGPGTYSTDSRGRVRMNNIQKLAQGLDEYINNPKSPTITFPASKGVLEAGRRLREAGNVVRQLANTPIRSVLNQITTNTGNPSTAPTTPNPAPSVSQTNANPVDVQQQMAGGYMQGFFPQVSIANSTGNRIVFKPRIRLGGNVGAANLIPRQPSSQTPGQTPGQSSPQAVEGQIKKRRKKQKTVTESAPEPPATAEGEGVENPLVPESTYPTDEPGAAIEGRPFPSQGAGSTPPIAGGTSTLTVPGQEPVGQSGTSATGTATSETPQAGGSSAAQPSAPAGQSTEGTTLAVPAKGTSRLQAQMDLANQLGGEDWFIRTFGPNRGLQLYEAIQKEELPESLLNRLKVIQQRQQGLGGIPDARVPYRVGNIYANPAGSGGTSFGRVDPVTEMRMRTYERDKNLVLSEFTRYLQEKKDKQLLARQYGEQLKGAPDQQRALDVLYRTQKLMAQIPAMRRSYKNILAAHPDIEETQTNPVYGSDEYIKQYLKRQLLEDPMFKDISPQALDSFVEHLMASVPQES